MSGALLEALRAAVGAAQVLTEGDLSAYELDWRRRWRGRALAVVRPASTDEVALVVRACAAHGASVVPQGGNTGLVGGGVTDASGTQVLLSTARMCRVRGIDAANSTITVDAGCVLQAVQRSAEAAGFLFPLPEGATLFPPNDPVIKHLLQAQAFSASSPARRSGSTNGRRPSSSRSARRPSPSTPRSPRRFS